MRFSLFFEFQTSDTSREAERKLFRETVQHVEMADILGYSTVWAAEHHGLAQYAHSSAPEVFLSYVAARTSNIRVGHGVTLTPGRYNHPIRVAERIATLDLLSEGRVEWGTGKSGSRTEQDAFEVDRNTLHEQWAESVRMIPRMWSDDVFEWHSDFYDIPPTQIVPKPVQQPHPRMYAACTSPKSAVMAGEMGLGALNFAAGTANELRAKVDEYRSACAVSAPETYQSTNRFLCTPTTLVLDDDKTACRLGYRGARFFWESMQAYYSSKARPTGPLPISSGDLDEEILDQYRRGRHDDNAPMTALIGDPFAVRDQVERFREIGVDKLVLVMQTGTVPAEAVATSIRVFAEKVMPDFAD